MKKIIFRKLIEDVTKFFLLTSISLSLIILVVQAVSFLDYISEDGHGFVTYFGITILNLPKIYTRVMPFCIFITIFYIKEFKGSCKSLFVKLIYFELHLKY